MFLGAGRPPELEDNEAHVCRVQFTSAGCILGGSGKQVINTLLYSSVYSSFMNVAKIIFILLWHLVCFIIFPLENTEYNSLCLCMRVLLALNP